MRLPNNFGTVFKLKGKRRNPWAVRKNNKYIGYTATKKEGLELLQKYNDNPTAGPNLTMQQVFNLWLKHRAREFAPRTVKDYTKKFNNYCGEFKNRKYKDLKLNDFLYLIEHTEAAESTKNTLIKLLKNLDKTAFDFDIIAKRYTDSIKLFREVKKRESAPFTEEEITTLWNNLEFPDVDLVLILIYTGLRSGELELLKLENIKDGFIKGGNKTKAGIDRLIPIHPRIAPLFNKRIQNATGQTLLNYSAKQLRIRFKRVMENFKMNHIPHEARHTFITRLDNAGVNRNIINLLAGHSSGNIGERVYTHKTRQQLTESILLLK